MTNYYVELVILLNLEITSEFLRTFGFVLR